MKGCCYAYFGKLRQVFVCPGRELLALDLTDPEEYKIIQEKNLFRTRCPELVRSAAQILEEMISEME